MRAHSIVWLCLLLILAAPARPASAQFIDRIEIGRSDGAAEIRLVFASQIQYLRHTPPQRGSQLRIFLQLADRDDPLASPGSLGRTLEETRKSPPSTLVPGFTATFLAPGGGLLLRFSKAIQWRVRPGADGRSISILVPVAEEAGRLKPPPKAEAAPAGKPVPVRPEAAPAPPEVTGEVAQQAQQLLTQAQTELQGNAVASAVESLNRLLNLPPNPSSQEAQELIGVARERNGELAKARAEYDLYLKLYPEGEGAKRVRERLARLGPEAAPPAAAKPGERPPEKPTRQVFGSVSQNYYFGKSRTELRPNTPGLLFEVPVLDTTDESSIVSTLDMTGRFRGENYDNRLVVRDTHRWSFLKELPSRNRLNAAYFENIQKDLGYLLRVGRQPGSTAGLLGSFDGLWFGKDVGSQWRVNALVGKPVDFFSDIDKLHYGVSLELLPAADKWSGNVYLVEQRVDHAVDRRALGTEVRYFDPRSNYFGLLDYDTMFKSVNIAMLQGNWFAEAGTNYFFLADYRKAPILQVSNALPGEQTQSVSAMIESIGSDEARRRAQALTQTSKLYQLGFTHPVTQRWQLGADVRLSNVTGTAASGVLPASPGTGNIWVYSAQTIGNGIFSENDVGVLNGSYIDAPSYSGYSLSVNHAATFWERWRLDMALRYYAQKDDFQVRLNRINPTLKLGYRWRDNLTLEGEGGFEQSRNESPTQTDKITRHYFYVGYRWDFF